MSQGGHGDERIGGPTILAQQASEASSKSKRGFDLAAEVLRAAAEENQGHPSPDLVAPDGWRWRVLGDLRQLNEDVLVQYKKAKDKQRSQAWESHLGLAATGSGAGIGTVISAVGAGVIHVTPHLGWALAILGLLVAVLSSMFSANTYVRNRNMKLRYLRMLHDLSDYAYMVLPTATAADVFAQLDAFRQLWESAGN